MNTSAIWLSGIPGCIRDFVLPQDFHTPDAEEFKAYAPHARMGTTEAETIKPIRDLPFSDEFVIVHKNSLSSVIDTTMGAWLADHPEVRTWIVVGDCTDLCVYQMAMYLRLAANAPDRRGRRMILPVNCVQTFDLGLHTAAEIKTVPHPGDLYDCIFLNQMARNAIEIVSGIA